MFLTQQMERINRELSLANDTLLTATKQEAYSTYTDRLLTSSSNTQVYVMNNIYFKNVEKYSISCLFF